MMAKQEGLSEVSTLYRLCAVRQILLYLHAQMPAWLEAN